MKIIAVCGHAKSGKDTAADYLVEYFGATKKSLATPIKEFSQVLFGFSHGQLYGPSDLRNIRDSRFDDSLMWTLAEKRLGDHGPDWVSKVTGSKKSSREYLALIDWFFELKENYSDNMSARKVLQTLGTEWGRAQNPVIWINYLLDHLEYNGTPIVITDARFNNELLAFKERKGKLVRIFRDDTDENANNLGVKNHQSEQELDSMDMEIFDSIIQNNGTLKEFLRTVGVCGDVLLKDKHEKEEIIY